MIVGPLALNKFALSFPIRVFGVKISGFSVDFYFFKDCSRKILYPVDVSPVGGACTVFEEKIEIIRVNAWDLVPGFIIDSSEFE
jgi:hypothetical protein